MLRSEIAAVTINNGVQKKYRKYVIWGKINLVIAALFAIVAWFRILACMTGLVTAGICNEWCMIACGWHCNYEKVFIHRL